MELYLIRHGQSYNNAVLEYESQRVPDPELTEIGHQQAQCVAEFLATSPNLEDIALMANGRKESAPHPRHRITHLYASPMHRALQTAKPISAALGLKVEVWIDTHEVGGIWMRKDGVVTGLGGLTRSQIQQHFPDYVLPETITELGWWNPQDGEEDIMRCASRAIRVAKALRHRATQEETMNDAVALVTHGTFMDQFIKALTNNLPSENEFFWHYNTAITRFDIHRDGRVVARYINRVTHLPPHQIT